MADVAARIAAASGDAGALLVLAIELAQENARLAGYVEHRPTVPPPPACRCARIRQRMREAKKKRHALAGAVTPRLRWEILTRDDYRCVACRRDDLPLHVDHITAIANGGLTVAANLQALCEVCNSGKGDA